MATSNNPSDGVQVITNPGTAVTPTGDDVVRDNTHTIVILNNTSGTDGFVRWQTGTTALTAANASVVPGGSSLTLSIGSKSQRPSDGQALLYFDSVGSAVTFQLTYINGLDL